MKKIFTIFAGIVFATLCQLVQAAPAVVSSLTGTAQAIPGAGAPRTLRVGDSVEQGETIATGDNSSLVLRFEDGQVVALTSRSRMAVNSYTYNQAEPAKSGMLLSLLNGSMRAVTGLIGKSDPSKVSYRVRNATIGIRGTDIIVGTDDDGKVAVIVKDGSVSFSFNGKTVLIPTGEAATTLANGDIQSASAAAIIALVAAQDPALAETLRSVDTPALQRAVEAAVAASKAAPPSGAGAGSGAPPTPGSNNSGAGSGSSGGGGTTTRPSGS